MRSRQRRMLPWMMPTARYANESWPDYIHRATHKVDALAAKYGVTDWVALHERRKWELAGKAARRTDNRWTRRLLAWRPWFRCVAHRDVGRPLTRWEDSIVRIAGGDWYDHAKDAELWSAAAPG